MSVLLQSLRTQKYVAVADEWTLLPAQAREFGGGVEAMFYCYNHHLDDMQILGRFPDAGQNFTIPLNVPRTE